MKGDDRSHRIRLSKSKLAAFEHCKRRLWLQLHRRDLAVHDQRTLALFDIGHRVGELARLLHPQGQLVTEDHRQVDAALARTEELIGAPHQHPIFEAAFERDGVVVRADILEPDGWGGWRLIEVKNSQSLKQYHVRDIATQAWAASASRICLSALVLRHVARRASQRALAAGDMCFLDVDITAEASAVARYRSQTVADARAVAAGPEPVVYPGTHCERPVCEFRAHCYAHASHRKGDAPITR